VVNNEEYEKRVRMIFNRINGVELSDIIKNKDLKINVASIHDENLRNYANLDIEYIAPDISIKQEMKNDHNKYNEAVRGLDYLATNEVEKNGEKSQTTVKKRC
jgi:hypothetical protein